MTFMRPLLAIFLTLCLCSGAWAQGWTMFGEPLAKTLGGSSSNGAACGVVPNFGSGWSEDMGSFSNCLNIDLISLPLNGVRVTWSQLTNCPTVEHFDRNLVYSMYWSPDNSTWTLINSQTNNTRASEWMTNDVPAPYRTNGYYTVVVRESDWTGGGAPAVADWYYVTNQISYTLPDPNISTGAENPTQVHTVTNWGTNYWIEYTANASYIAFLPNIQAFWSNNSYGKNSLTVGSNSCAAYQAAGFGFGYQWRGDTLNVPECPEFGAHTTLDIYGFMHEAGHGMGLGHANSIVRSGDWFINDQEYGNTGDIMSQNSTPFHYNAHDQERIGWLGPTGNRPIALASTNGTALYTFESPDFNTSGPKALKIPLEDYWLYDNYTEPPTLLIHSNIFYYLEIKQNPASPSTPYLTVLFSSPYPYYSQITPATQYHTYKVTNYGYGGALIAGSTFQHRLRVKTQFTGQLPSTNYVIRPYSVLVVSVQTNSASVIVNWQ